MSNRVGVIPSSDDGGNSTHTVCPHLFSNVVIVEMTNTRVATVHLTVSQPKDDQRELLRLLATGMPDTAIARRMRVAPRTLARRIASLYRELQADNRFQAGAAAQRLGWLAETT
jgi:DNA-binding NarL/FixJ family response regulator